MARYLVVLTLSLTLIQNSQAEITRDTDEKSGMEVVTLREEGTIVQMAAAAGANVFSIRVDGVEYFRQPESLEKLPGVGYGNPVLYPMPNRVKDATFTFNGQRIEFEPNAGKNFIHGLVNRYPWQIVGTRDDDGESSIQCLADFGVGTELHQRFPFAHKLFLTVSVRPNSVRWHYEVDNRDGNTPIPFGFALHPYFIYQGERAATYLTIPATHWMEAADRLPSGKLVAAHELDYPLGKPLSLDGTSLDDVFSGMTPQRPTLIEFRDMDRQVIIRASEEFTHLVVWTPQQTYFGVESQTCSTDAHNLHERGGVDAAHLQICAPGETLDGWVEYSFTTKWPASF